MVVEPEAGVIAVTTAAAAAATGQVAVDVKGGNAAPAGVAVCAQDTIAVVAAAPGVQLTPMAGAFAPTIAGAVMVRLAPAVIANADAPGGTVQASAKLPGAVPAVTTVTGIVPAPAVRVVVAAIVAVGATAAPAGHVIVEVNAGSAAPAGVAVWAHVSVPVTAAAPEVQLKPIAGALAPSVAGAAMVRFAPAVIANATVPGAMVQAKATLETAVPCVATVTGTVPTPPIKVTAAGKGLSVGGVFGSGPAATANEPSVFVHAVGFAPASIQPLPAPLITIGNGEVMPAVKPARLVNAKLQYVPA